MSNVTNPIEIFFNEISAAKKALKFNPDRKEECFFRGQSNTNDLLLPTLHRSVAHNVNFKKLKKNALSAFNKKLNTIESDLFFEFRRLSASLISNKMSDWDLLFLMRHYKVKTRILDWSDNLSTALYFALNNYSEDAQYEPCIWLLNPYLLNKKSRGFRELIAPEYIYSDAQGSWDYGECLESSGDWLDEFPIAIYPTISNLRLNAQNGYFTFQGNDPRPLELIYPGCVKKVTINKTYIPFLKTLLFEILALNNFKMSVDFESLAETLHVKYKLI